MESIEQVITLFKKEFSYISEQFNTFELLISDALKNGTKDINCAGVYIFWNPKFGVIKVGKSQSNSKKRALQHLTDNTANNKLEMKNLNDEPDTKLLLINIKDNKSLHWVLSLEAFLEWNLNPVIHSARMG